jgi:hypothetical protein
VITCLPEWKKKPVASKKIKKIRGYPMSINNITGSFGRLTISDKLYPDNRRAFEYEYADFINYCSHLTGIWIEIDVDVGTGQFYFRIMTTFSSDVPQKINRFLSEQKIVQKGNAYYHDKVRIVFSGLYN